MPLKFRIILFIFVFFGGLVSCTDAVSTVVNEVDHTSNTNTPSPILQSPTTEGTSLPPTTSPILTSNPFSGNEMTLLLRSRTQPIELRVIGLPMDCLTGLLKCEEVRDISVLPETLVQVYKLFWTSDSKYAFFWDSDTGDIFTLNGVSGEIKKLKEKVWKTSSQFFISPNGSQMIFEIGTGPFESDIVSMDMNSGEIKTFDIPLPCMKFIKTWLTDKQILFWCEIYTGDKGDLDDIEVYVFDLETQFVQPFDIGRDWMEASIPDFAPSRQVMVFTSGGTTIIRNVVTSQERILDINPEKYIWSDNSDWLAIYSQSKEIFVSDMDGQNISKVYTFPENILLEDWLWLPGNKTLLLIVSDDDGNKTLSVLSLENCTISAVNLPFLNEYEVISLSYRPTNR